LDGALKKIGLRPENIDIVIFMHLYRDHCFSREQLTKATSLVQKRELQYT